MEVPRDVRFTGSSPLWLQPEPLLSGSESSSVSVGISSPGKPLQLLRILGAERDGAGCPPNEMERATWEAGGRWA